MTAVKPLLGRQLRESSLDLLLQENSSTGMKKQPKRGMLWHWDSSNYNGVFFKKPTEFRWADKALIELPDTTVWTRNRARVKIQAGSGPLFWAHFIPRSSHKPGSRPSKKQFLLLKKKKKELVLNSYSPKKLNVSSSHKSLYALTTELPKGHPAHAEQLLQNLHQFNVKIHKMRLNLFPSLLQKALWFCEPWSVLQGHQKRWKKKYNIHQSFPPLRWDATWPPSQALQIIMYV